MWGWSVAATPSTVAFLANSVEKYFLGNKSGVTNWLQGPLYPTLICVLEI